MSGTDDADLFELDPEDPRDADLVFTGGIAREFKGRSTPATVEDIADLCRVIIIAQRNLMEISQVVLTARRFNKRDLNGFIKRYRMNVETISNITKRLDARSSEE